MTGAGSDDEDVVVAGSGARVEIALAAALQCDDGGCGDCDDEVERVLPPVSATSGLDFGAVKMITPTVTLRGPGLVAQEGARPLRLLPLGTSATYVIFNK